MRCSISSSKPIAQSSAVSMSILTLAVRTAPGLNTRALPPGGWIGRGRQSPTHLLDRPHRERGPRPNRLLRRRLGTVPSWPGSRSM
jgi:hypothetical protein